MKTIKATPQKQHTQIGFTLLEMIVVISIIGLILGLVGPRLFGAADSSKVKIAQTQIKLIRGNLETYRLDMGSFPSTEQGLNALVKAPNTPATVSRWKGPYAEEVPMDPWGNPYVYKVPGEQGQPFSLISLGQDGKPGGEGLDADIGIGIAAPATATDK